MSDVDQGMLEGGAGTLLLVDDNVSNLSVLSELLYAAGYRVLIARDGESALTRATNANPDLILLDVMMPGLDGFETCKRMKAQPDISEIPVIFMTALTSEMDKIRGFEAGAIDYITKPFQKAEVLARVNTHVSIARLTHDLKQLNARLDAAVQERTRQLQQALVEVEQLNKEKNDNLITSANELQFPLAVLQEQWNTLQKEQGGKSDTAERLGESIEILVGIIRSMVELARLDAAKRTPVRQTTSLQQIFDKLCFQYDPVLIRRKLNLDVQLAHLPYIEADPVHLSIAFENIIANAIAYTPDGGKIIVSGDVRDTSVVVAIHDTGIGIAPEDRERIFDRYYRAGLNSSTRSRERTDFLGGGAGLGLVVAKEIICGHHGGRIWVESVGRDMDKYPGSTFYISLPASLSAG